MCSGTQFTRECVVSQVARRVRAPPQAGGRYPSAPRSWAGLAMWTPRARPRYVAAEGSAYRGLHAWGPHLRALLGETSVI